MIATSTTCRLLTHGVLNDRKNIIVMVDEAHRTQEGDLGRKMREALPNAFLFGLTGTPINKTDRNTFWAFGADECSDGPAVGRSAPLFWRRSFELSIATVRGYGGFPAATDLGQPVPASSDKRGMNPRSLHS